MIGVIFPVLRPILERLDPERAHDLTIRALEFAPALRPAASDPRLAVEAFGLAFSNPLGFAAGFDKGARAVPALFGLGFGAVEIGAVTPLPQTGNPRPRLFRSSRDAAVLNRFGFNSEGHAIVRARIARMNRRRGVLGVNLGANRGATDRAADYAAGVAAFADVADYLAINVSSPNTPGLRDLQGRGELDALLARVLEVREGAIRRPPVLLKIAPDLTLFELDDIVAVARARNVDGLIVSNTTSSRPASLDPALAKEEGGLSGRPLFAPSTRLLAHAFLRVEGAFPLVGVGGVEGPETALAKIRAGASLVQLYSALVFQGPGLVRRILDGLGRALDATPGGKLAALVGQDAEAVTREGTR